MSDGGKRTGVGLRQRFELVTDRGDLIPVAHPNGHLVGKAGEQRFLPSNVAGRRSVFPGGRVVDLSAQGLAGQLHPVADSQDGDPQTEQFRIALRRPVFVDAGRAARKNDAFGSEFGHSLGGNVMPNDLAVNALFADSSSDQLRVLRSEVEDNNSLSGQRPAGAVDQGDLGAVGGRIGC